MPSTRRRGLFPARKRNCPNRGIAALAILLSLYPFGNAFLLLYILLIGSFFRFLWCANFAQRGLTAHYRVANLHISLAHRLDRHIHLRARTEFNHTIALPAGQSLPGLDLTDDAARENAGDLLH